MKYGGQSGSTSATRHRAYSYYEGSQSSSKYNPKFAEESRLRIIQNNLICVSGLADSISNKQILRSKKYFGKYGEINKIMISSNRGYGNKSQAYITYERKVDAAIAMMAVDQIVLAGRQISATYGTTKYCTHFLKGIECRNNQCYFMHQYDANNELDDSHKGNLMKESIETAIITINNNLEYYVKKQIEEANHESQEIPSIRKTLQILVENGDIYASDYQSIKDEEMKKHIAKTKLQGSPAKQNSIKNASNDDINQKKTKSISISTKGSPTKESESGILQNTCGTDSKGDIADRIENLIIKSIMGKRCIYQSRFAFASSQSASSQDCIKLRNYVKKHLLKQII